MMIILNKNNLDQVPPPSSDSKATEDLSATFTMDCSDEDIVCNTTTRACDAGQIGTKSCTSTGRSKRMKFPVWKQRRSFPEHHNSSKTKIPKRIRKSFSFKKKSSSSSASPPPPADDTSSHTNLVSMMVWWGKQKLIQHKAKKAEAEFEEHWQACYGDSDYLSSSNSSGGGSSSSFKRGRNDSAVSSSTFSCHVGGDGAGSTVSSTNSTGTTCSWEKQKLILDMTLAMKQRKRQRTFGTTPTVRSRDYGSTSSLHAIPEDEELLLSDLEDIESSESDQSSFVSLFDSDDVNSSSSRSSDTLMRPPPLVLVEGTSRAA